MRLVQSNGRLFKQLLDSKLSHIYVSIDFISTSKRDNLPLRLWEMIEI